MPLFIACCDNVAMGHYESMAMAKECAMLTAYAYRHKLIVITESAIYADYRIGDKVLTIVKVIPSTFAQRMW